LLLAPGLEGAGAAQLHLDPLVLAAGNQPVKLGVSVFVMVCSVQNSMQNAIVIFECENSKLHANSSLKFAQPFNVDLGSFPPKPILEHPPGCPRGWGVLQSIHDSRTLS
jgi:hypothetical protein